MPSLSTATATNASYAPGYVPVFVIFGGTSGIGEAIARGAARYTTGRAHIVIVGRNKVAADSILASFPTPSEQDAKDSTYEFVSCDVNLMKNVHGFSEELKKRVNKINYLILSAGVMGLGGREETEEGIDKKLASRYYSRFAAIHDLVPLLRNAKAAGEDAAVLSVLGPGYCLSVDFDDLGLKKRYTGMKAIKQSTAYNDLMVQAFSERDPDIAFIHIHPGLVDTGVFQTKSRLLTFLIRPVVWMIAISPSKCAEWMIFALLNTKKGMSRRTAQAEEMGLRDFPVVTTEQKQLFWDHSVASVTALERGD